MALYEYLKDNDILPIYIFEIEVWNQKTNPISIKFRLLNFNWLFYSSYRIKLFINNQVINLEIYSKNPQSSYLSLKVDSTR